MRTSPLRAFINDGKSKKNKQVTKPKGGFMHPPYKKPVGPTEKPHYVHGYKDFDSNLEKKEDAKGVSTNIKMPKVMKDGPKNRMHFHKKK